MRLDATETDGVHQRLAIHADLHTIALRSLGRPQCQFQFGNLELRIDEPLIVSHELPFHLQLWNGKRHLLSSYGLVQLC